MKLISRWLCCALLPVACSIASAGSWHTYHGGPALRGVSERAFPERPSRLWRTRVGTALPSAITGGDGRLFCIADTTNSTALSAEGKVLWTRSFPRPPRTPEGKPRRQSFTAPPLYVDKTLVVFASDSGMVYGLRPEDGKPLWEHDTGALIQGSPNYEVREGKRVIFVIEREKGVIHALSGEDGRPLWKSEELDRTDGHPAVDDGLIVIGNCTSSFIALDTSDGRTLSIVKVGEESEMAGGVAISKRKAFAGTRSGTFAAADIDREAVAWRHEKSAGEMFATPALKDDIVIFISPDSKLYCAAASSGREHWVLQLDGFVPLSPIIAGDLVIAGVDGTLSGITLKTGSKVWQFDAGDEISQPAVIDGMIVVGSDDGHIAAYGKDSKE